MTSAGTRPRRTAWSAARELAERTPATRNRYVDLLRAVSILAVVVGHWLIAAPHFRNGEIYLDHMLDISPWTQWLTWGFQVMPVFFIVGGYSNAASWSAALRSGRSFGTWFASRLQRLLGPVLMLIAVWTLLGLAGRLGDLSPATIKIGSQAALVPIWFLAVYVMVAILVPATHAAWRRFGFGSFWALAGAAVLVDAAVFGAGLRALGWTNYMFVWLAVHQLGYAWRDDRLGGPKKSLPWAFAGLAALFFLMAVANYPRSMVGVPGEEVSNTLPPTLAMLALAALQSGLLLSIEQPARRWLNRTAPWTATILINGMIMTVCLWHLTVLVLTAGAATLLGGIGLGLEPGSPTWWASRPIWMAWLALGLFPFLAVFGRFERVTGGRTGLARATWRLVLGSLMVCGGMALLALSGIGSDGPLGIRVWVVGMAFAGAALAGLGPVRQQESG